jgi:uncharacterized protein YjbI with pentapeptide repeats
MFTQIHLLPQLVSDTSRKMQERWESGDGQKLHSKILGMIRSGAGEDFLQYDFQQRHLSFLEHEHDLRGFKFQNQNIKFPHKETFENIDFSYGEFFNSTFENGGFYCTMELVKFFNCSFIECSYFFNSCYACLFDRVQFDFCNFLEGNIFINCDFRYCQFNNTFFYRGIFIDCRFDSLTNFKGFPQTPIFNERNIKMENVERSNFYSGISDAYRAGSVIFKSRFYLFRQQQQHTRHNTTGIWNKFIGYFSEYLLGYGLKPMRPIYVMLLFYLAVLTIFSTKFNLQDALFLTCGALLTFGAKVDLLDFQNIFFHVLYVVTAFVGISCIALFITLLSNYLRRDE